MTSLHEACDALRAALAPHPALAVAVSGGVDSMTLAAFAMKHRAAGSVALFHAVSDAVPQQATERVRQMARTMRWPLTLIQPGELEQEAYVSNPVNRCLYCKRGLYDTIRRYTSAQIVSGANLDDLGDYRPGLQAAAEAAVEHPFITAGIGKAMVREMARHLGLGALAELPASPCLSSRVETGVRIEAPMLSRIDAAERFIRERTGARDVRCRVRHQGVVIEIDEQALQHLGEAVREEVARQVQALFAAQGRVTALPRLEAYRMGSAFIQSKELA